MEKEGTVMGVSRGAGVRLVHAKPGAASFPENSARKIAVLKTSPSPFASGQRPSRHESELVGIPVDPGVFGLSSTAHTPRADAKSRKTSVKAP